MVTAQVLSPTPAAAAAQDPSAGAAAALQQGSKLQDGVIEVERQVMAAYWKEHSTPTVEAMVRKER